MCRRNRYGGYGGYGARRCGGGGYREERNHLIDDIIAILASRHQQPQQLYAAQRQQPQPYAGQQPGYNVGVVNMQRGAAPAGYYQGTGKSEEKMQDRNQQQWRKGSVDPPTYGEVMNNIA